MSTTIDERVVEMRFDNRHFEKNVSNSLSTLDKLKQKLNFTGAAKGFENINSAAKNINLSGLSSGVDSLKAKFSALDVMGVTALANITNSAVNAGKRIASALTIDPIKTGFSEYETQINAVQTILANTSSKGTTIEDVNKALDTLNTYADKTIYNFTEMTRNIGTFTAAGVDLNTSVSAIQGIANLAAVSGSTSQQASTAMYQLSQALAAGKVSLQDWNSVVNAGMGGEVFQNALKRTAKTMGIVVDESISFRESISSKDGSGWLTSDVLLKTLEQFTMAAEEGSEQWNKYKKSLMMEGYTDKQATEILKMANTATDAATKVKTFTQLWDTLKESAQSGWTQTWELLIGDFEEAKELLTGISDYLGGFINKMSEARNKLLGAALGNPFAESFKGLSEKIDKVTGATDSMTGALEKYQNLANEVIKGNWGNGAERIERLTKAGYDWASVQNLVNEKLGDAKRHETDYKLAQEGSNKARIESIEQLLQLEDAQLSAIGFTQDEIKALRELEKQSKKTGIPIEDLIKDMDQLNGRTLLINSFKNVGKSLVTIFQSIGTAWRDAFPAMKPEQLYNIIAALHKFSTKLVISEETAGKLTRTFKGLFAILDLVASVTGGAVRFAFKVTSKILEAFDLDILTVTANVGDAIVAFRNWVEDHSLINKAIEKMVPLLKEGAERIKTWATTSEALANGISNLKDILRNAKGELKDWISGLKETDNLGEYIVQGLVKGLKFGIKTAAQIMVELGKTILNSIKEVLGIHSPSTEFIEIGENVIAGFVEGLQNGASKAWEALKNFGAKCIEIIKDIDWGKVFALGLGIGMLVISKKIADALQMFAAPLEGLGDMFSGIGEMFEGLGENFKAKAWQRKSKALLNMAIAIGILAASIYLLAQLDYGKLWSAVGAIVVLGGVLTGLMFVAEKMNDIKGFDVGVNSTTILAIAGSLLLVAIAMKQLASIDVEDLPVVFATMGGAILGMIGIVAAFGKLVKVESSGNIAKVGGMLLSMSIALLIMVGVIKLASGLELGDVVKGIGVVAATLLLFKGIIKTSKAAGEFSNKAGGMMLSMSIALLLMVGVIKAASMLETGDVVKGLAIIASVELLFAGIIAASKLAGDNAGKAGGMLLSMSLALMIMVGVIKLAGGLNIGEIIKGLGAITVLEILFAGIIAVSKYAGQNAGKAGLMFIAMSGAMLILTGVIYIIGQMDVDTIAKGIVAVTLLGALFGGLMYASSMVPEEGMKNIITITVAIGLLAVAMAALTFLDTKELLASSAALTMVILSFSAALAATGKMNTYLETALPAIAIMLLVVGGLAMVIVELNKIESSTSLLETTAALSILILSLSASLMALNRIPNVDITTLGTVAIMVLILAEIGGALKLLELMNVSPNLETAASLSILLLALSGACIILAGVGTFATQAVTGAIALSAVVATLTVLVGGLAGLLGAMNSNSKEVVLGGMDFLILLFGKLGELIGSIISGFGVGLTSGLPEIGTNLSTFMDNLSGFIEGVKMVDESVWTGIKNLATAILLLTAADFVNGLVSFTPFSGGLPMLGWQLSKFMEQALPFLTTAQMIKPEMVEGVKLLAEAILLLSAASFVDGISNLFGEDVGTIETLGQQLPTLGTAIKEFAANLGNFGPTQIMAVQGAAVAMRDLAKAAADIPNSGGLLAEIVGDNGIATFSNRLPGLGTNLNKFVTNLGTFEKAQVATVDCASRAITALATAAADIPNSGGLWAEIVGDNGLATFSNRLPGLGLHLNKFITNLGTFDKMQLNTVTCAGDAITTLANAASKLPNDGGVWGRIFGENSIATFSDNLPTLGSNLNTFVTNLGAFGEKQINTVYSAIGAINAFARLGEIDLVTATTYMNTFGSQVVTFADKISEFSSKLSEVDGGNIDTAVSNVKKIVKMISDMQGFDGTAATEFKKALNDLGKSGVSKFVEAFTSENAKKNVKNAGVKVMQKLIDGLESEEKSLNRKVKAIATGAGKNIGTEEQYKSWYNAGAYLVEGFAAGISENDYQAEAKAKAMAKAAKQAAEEALGIESPSKEFYKVGDFSGQGFVNALDDYADISYRAAYSMSDAAKQGLSDAISKVKDLINTDMDLQPTIRPVMDLTNVRANATAISRMFNQRASLSVMSNVGAINSMMNARVQNGLNDEVVSAINKLRKDIGNIGGTTYNVGGITYDDGSNVSNAVKALIRATKMEGRV